jgi:hypothetical protein
MVKYIKRKKRYTNMGKKDAVSKIVVMNVSKELENFVKKNRDFLEELANH